MTTSTFVGRRRRPARRVLLALSTILCSGLAAPGFAQTTPTPSRPITDDNGVELSTGTIAARSKSIAIANLSFENIWGGSVDETTFTNAILDRGFYTVVFIDGNSILFVRQPDDTFKPEVANGARLTIPGNGTAVYVSPNGARYEFQSTGPTQGGGLANYRGNNESRFRISRMVTANGEIRTWNYRMETVGSNCSGRFNLCQSFTDYLRLQSVTTNTGLMLKAAYASNTPGTDFNKLTSVKAINLAVDYCNPSADSCANLSQSWPTLSITLSTDQSGLQQKLLSTPGGDFVARLLQSGLVEVNGDNQNNADFSVTRYPDGKIYQVNNRGTITTYTYTTVGSQLTVTRTRSNNIVDSWVISNAGSNRLDSKTDELGRQTSYEYDIDGRLYRTTAPEGNKTELTYDPVGRVTEIRRKAKPNSGLADIVETAGYATNCTIESVKYCLKPLWTQDARGNRTDYTYGEDHGEVTRVQLPAPTTGQPRPQTDYSYSALYAKMLNSSGVLVDATTPVWKLTRVSSCAVASSCAGSPNEQVATIEYGANLLPTRVTIAAGDGSVSSSVAYTYDTADNVISADGPLSGTDDTVFYFWDSDRRFIGTIGADPDGAGVRLRQARRVVYDGDRLARTEIGTTNGTDKTALDAMTVLQTIESTFDANDYKTVDRLVAGGATQAVSQYSYDAKGQLECVAVRMNPAVFGSLPSSACSLGTSGSNGSDRITRNVYDAAGQLLQVKTAYGTAIEADEATGTYNDNGTLATLTDAEGNKTSYDYDGFDRLVKTRYPSTTAGSGTSSSSDYEQLGYDSGSNVVSRRLRDGQTISYSYDLLGRLTLKDLPSPEGDVSYGYDLLGRALTATQGGLTLTNSYDALGRLTSAAQPYGTISYQYDAAGQRTRMTWSDGFYVSYDHRVTGEVSAIRENGATSGVGVLAAYAYDDLGRRTGVTLGNGTTTTYGFDAVSRLTSLAQNLAGTANDLTLGFGYNPAGQIVSATRSNDNYAWTGAVNVDRDYTTNGLNQYSVSGPVSLGYDARGNLTSSGSSSYGYTSENLLKSVGSVTLAYDPVGRLSQYDTSTATRFVYDGGAIVAELNTSSGLLRRYVPGPGTDEPIVWYEGSGTGDRRFLHADERGSVIALSDSNGATIATNAYDEYGIPASGNVGRFGYTGQAWLPEIGLAYYKARMYSPSLGRFMQTDPIGYADGLNWYAYVGGDPINRTDPSGRCETTFKGRVYFWHYAGHDNNWGCSDSAFLSWVGDAILVAASGPSGGTTGSAALRSGTANGNGFGSGDGGRQPGTQQRDNTGRRNRLACNYLRNNNFNSEKAWNAAVEDRNPGTSDTARAWNDTDLRLAENFLFAAARGPYDFEIWTYQNVLKPLKRTFGPGSTPYSADAVQAGYDGTRLYGKSPSEKAQWCRNATD